jgi:DNA-binding transcriptional LysR family regulator
MEFRHLQYFVAVAEELNFRRAARRLHVSPPSVSVQVKMLEELLNVRLCDRNTTGVRLTAAGEVLLREARGLLQQTEKLKLATQEAALGEREVLRIGSPGQFAYSFMYKAVDIYRKRFPNVGVSLTEFDVELEQPGALENGTIQLGFVYDAQLSLIKDAGHLLVIDTPMRVVVGSAHPLAALREISLAQLAGYPLLSVKRYDSHIKNMLLLLQEKRLAPKAVQKVDGYTAYLSMLAAGQGVSMLPEMRILSGTEGIVTRPLKDDVQEGIRVKVYAVWKNAGAPPQVRNFVEVLRSIGTQHD